jgi:hypothetical protein
MQFLDEPERLRAEDLVAAGDTGGPGEFDGHRMPLLRVLLIIPHERAEDDPPVVRVATISAVRTFGGA